MEKIKFNERLEKNGNLNRGQQMEKIASNYFKVEYKKDNANHLNDSDINVNNLHISVKSKDCSLDNLKTHTNLQNSIENFLQEDFSNTYLYMVENTEKEIYGYLMNKEEFGKFLQAKASITSDNKFRIRKSDSNVNIWFSLNF